MATPEPPLIAGNGLTVTVTTAVLMQPAPLVPVTVYVVVPAGLAVTLAPVAADNPVDGDQAYEVELPVAVNVVDEPAHIATLDPLLIAGNGFTVTVTAAVLLHPLAVPVTV